MLLIFVNILNVVYLKLYGFFSVRDPTVDKNAHFIYESNSWVGNFDFPSI